MLLLSMCTSICCSRQPLQYSCKQPAMACIDSTATLSIQMSQMKPPPPSELCPSCVQDSTFEHETVYTAGYKKVDLSEYALTEPCQCLGSKKQEQQLQFRHLWLHLCCDLHCLCGIFDSWQSCCRTDQCIGQPHRQKQCLSTHNQCHVLLYAGASSSHAERRLLHCLVKGEHAFNKTHLLLLTVQERAQSNFVCQQLTWHLPELGKRSLHHAQGSGAQQALSSEQLAGQRPAANKHKI